MLQYKNIDKHAVKLLLLGHLIMALAFIVPAKRLWVAGAFYDQYLLSGYPGWVVLGILVVFTIIQSICYFKTNKSALWIALLTGLYCMAYAVVLTLKATKAFSAAATDSLANKLEVSFTPLAGLWLLAIGGGMLFTFAIVAMYQSRHTAARSETAGLHS